jgi:4-hydroxybenzoate polyprenyltransferase
MESTTAEVKPVRGVAAVGAILGDIHVEQTLFSLPFVVVSALLAQRTDHDAGRPYHDRSPWERFAWIVLALLAARSCAMAANRFADAVIDKGNPRTARRAVPSGRVSRGAMGAFALATLAVFLFAAWKLNTLCLALSPVALLFLIGYSWTKRFTPLCHVWLGVAIGIAPLGAWAGMHGDLASPVPWCLFAAVATWIAGFDILYACPDVEIDVRDGLRSIPQTLGVARAFRVSEALHVATVAALAATGVLAGLRWPWWAGLAVGAVLLVVEHRIVRPGDYRRMATAFFRLNAVFGFTMLAATAIDLFVVG